MLCKMQCAESLWKLSSHLVWLSCKIWFIPCARIMSQNKVLLVCTMTFTKLWSHLLKHDKYTPRSFTAVSNIEQTDINVISIYITHRTVTGPLQRPASQIFFGTSYTSAHTVWETYSKQILLGDQTRCEEIFLHGRVDHECWRAICLRHLTFCHVTPILKSLHLFKINECIEYKLLSLTYKVLTTAQTTYLHSLISVQPPRATRPSSVVTLSRPPTSSSLRITNRSFRRALPNLTFLFIAVQQ